MSCQSSDLKFVLFSFLIVGLTGCGLLPNPVRDKIGIYRVYDVRRVAPVKEFPEAEKVLAALSEDPAIVEVRHVPPRQNASLLDRLIGGWTYEEFYVRGKTAHFTIYYVIDKERKSVLLFDQVYANGDRFAGPGQSFADLEALMTGVYDNLHVRFPVLPPNSALQQTVEPGSGH
jgi:hypothetical protein